LKICFVCYDNNKVVRTKNKLVKLYGNYSPKECDVIVALGGDGFFLRTIHKFKDLRKPFYGMNFGTVGFLMNKYEEKNLIKKLNNTQSVKIKPLIMKAKNQKNKNFKSLAFNEVSLIRKNHQAAKLSIKINGVIRMEELVCDGLMVSTPAGSTAYNLSAHGPIIPLGTNVVALTPISPFRPRRWRGALLPEETKIEIYVQDSKKRPVNISADQNEFKDLKSVIIGASKDKPQELLFSTDHSFEERILTEQFTE
tara:strand:- start:535 stop:1293 length:759 start_codon:yes stop_codon:yes gene_type:complete